MSADRKRFRSKHGKFVSKKKGLQLMKVIKANQRRVTQPNARTEEGDEPTEESAEANSPLPAATPLTPVCVTADCNALSLPPSRRIVELDTLGESLLCDSCENILSLRNLVDERQYGLASKLYVTCACGVLNEVYTCKSHRNNNKKKKGLPIYDVNTKAAAGMLHSGSGISSINSWLASVNIPVPAETTWKRWEREIGPIIEDVAQQSCIQALEEETRLTALNQGMSEITYMELTAGYDMGWQRRGTGRGAKSLSGHGSLVGYHSGKLLAYGARKMSCKICEVADKAGRTPVSHDCRRNWKGSAKAMEPSLGVELLQKTRSEKAAVHTLIMDEDASTIAHVRREYDDNTVKWSDTNHAKKCLTNALYKLQPKYKKILTAKVIKYFAKNYAYVLAQNKNNEEGLRAGLLSIVPHVFGDHTQCGDWCGYKKSPETYKHKSLPRGQDLSGDDLRQDLEKVFQIHAFNAAKLAPLGSTLTNESWNNTVASKAPKAKHYSGSESLDYRIGSAAAQKNLGPGYMEDVFIKTALSPSGSLATLSERLKRKYEKRKEKARTKGFKRRRLELGEVRTSRLRSLELREGQSYGTGIDMGDTVLDIDSIPPIMSPPAPDRLTKQPEHRIVYFDLETTDIEADASICQISAVGQDDVHFNVYTLPEKPIDKAASAVTHLQLHDTTLTYKDVPVTTVSIKKGLEDFLAFLKSYEQVILVGHNVKNFDVIHFLRHVLLLDLKSEFDKVIVGFSDTLPLFRELYPGRSKHSQESLVADFVGSSYNAHNALEDCKALKNLISKTKAVNDLMKHSLTLVWAWSHVQYVTEKRQNLMTFAPLVAAKVMTKYCANKCAASGLKVAHLKLAYERNGEDGLKDLFMEKGAMNTCRVSTKPGKIVMKLSKYFNRQ